jgi:ethanolamine utilization protein
MDFNLLVEEILARVSEHLAGVNTEQNTVTKKDKILIIAENHGTVCHGLLDNSNLQKYYHIECAMQRGYNCDLNDYEVIVMYNISIDALSKLASGICDTPFISLALKTILMGKKIFVPLEEVELYTYKNSAPCAYYSMMNEKLNLLSNSGVIFCKNNELEKLILEKYNLAECNIDGSKQDDISHDGTKYDEIKRDDIKPQKLSKKIITEGDIRKLFVEGTKSISINSNAILTDLAKDFIHNKQIEIERESPVDGKPRKGL